MKICDPYISIRALDLLVRVDKSVMIKIISHQLEDIPKGIFSRTLSELRREGFDINVRIYNNSELHDRYVITDKGMWLVGHSLKDIRQERMFYNASR